MSLYGNIFARARVAASSLSEKMRAVLVNVERYVGPEEPPEASAEEICFGGLGAYGRPEPPSATKVGTLDAGECEVFCARTMDGFQPIGFRDLRISKRSNPAIGEVGIGQYGGGFLSLRWDRDRQGTVVALSAPRLNAGGETTTSHYLSMDPSDAGNSVMLVHRSGSYLALNKDGCAILASSDGKQTITLTPGTGGGVSIAGKLSFLGGILAGSTNSAQPLAIAGPHVDFATLVNAALLALNTAVAPLAPPAGPLTPAQITQLAAALAALSAAGTSQVVKASPT